MFIKNSETTAILLGGVAQVVLLSELIPMTAEDHKYHDDKERARCNEFGGKSYDALVGCSNGTKQNDNHIHRG